MDFGKKKLPSLMYLFASRLLKGLIYQLHPPPLSPTLHHSILSDSKLAKFQPNWFTGCRLGVLNVPSTCPDFHFEKTVEKDFWRRITRDEIITDYNTKAVNVDAYQRRDNNSDTARIVENETRQQMNNLFQRLCSVRSFLLSRKLH